MQDSNLRKIHIYMNIHIHTFKLASSWYKNTYMHTYICTSHHPDTHTRACMHTYIHAYIGLGHSSWQAGQRRSSCHHKRGLQETACQARRRCQGRILGASSQLDPVEDSSRLPHRVSSGAGCKGFLRYLDFAVDCPEKHLGGTRRSHTVGVLWSLCLLCRRILWVTGWSILMYCASSLSFCLLPPILLLLPSLLLLLLLLLLLE